MAQGPLIAAVGQIPSGAASLAAFGAQKDQLISALHGSKYTQAYRGALFMGANQALDTLSAGLATTYTGLCLSNPAASKVNLVLRRVTGVLDVAPAALTALGLITGWSAAGITVHTTALTPQTALIGGTATPSAKLDAACTLVGTPVWSQFLAETPATTSVTSFTVDEEGAIVIAPGGYVAVGASIAGPSSGFFGSMEWEEVAL